MAWLFVVGYAALVAVTWWLTGSVRAFEAVCVDDRGPMAMVWPLTWIAAGCVALLYGIVWMHERWFPDAGNL